MKRVKQKFDFKQFSVYHDRAAMKVGTDGVLLGAWASIHAAPRILDVGTGSGVIALMFAQRSDANTHIEAIDISDDCEQAQENVLRSPWPRKISVIQKSLQEYTSELFDVIVSNPPFFINSYKPPTTGRTRARHTDTLTHTELLDHSKRLLKPAGRLNLVLPETEAILFETSANTKGWYCTRKCIFRSRISKPPERILLELRLEELPLREEELVLYATGLEWSAGYRALTRDFYMNA